jgi:hypothetical protein
LFACFQGGQFKATTFDAGSQRLIAAYPQGAANSLGTEVEMVHYVDSSGHELSQEEVQYYALDGQEYSVIQVSGRFKWGLFYRKRERRSPKIFSCKRVAKWRII